MRSSIKLWVFRFIQLTDLGGTYGRLGDRVVASVGSCFIAAFLAFREYCTRRLWQTWQLWWSTVVAACARGDSLATSMDESLERFVHQF